MSQTIWKFEVHTGDLNIVPMPRGAEILSVQKLNDSFFLWAKCDPLAPKIPRHIACYGTGQENIKPEAIFISTVQMYGGAIILHFFELPQ